MKKTDALTTTKNARPRQSLLQDIRGANEFVQTIILVACVALAGIAGFSALGGKISEKAGEKGATKKVEDLPNLK
jgi:hypothetical protein